MAAPSTPGAIMVDDDVELSRPSDDAAAYDEDENGAPTLIAPLSRAFVDQLMFKASIAESVPPTSTPSSVPPASGSRPRLPEPGELSHAVPPGAVPPDAVPPDAPTSPSLEPLGMLELEGMDLELEPHLEPDVALTPTTSPPVFAAPLFIEPSLSANAARWMAASSVYPQGAEHELGFDKRRLAIGVALVIGALALATIFVIVWLFP